jgi:hypothetical protein
LSRVTAGLAGRLYLETSVDSVPIWSAGAKVSGPGGFQTETANFGQFLQFRPGEVKSLRGNDMEETLEISL